MRVRRRLYGVVFLVLLYLAAWVSYADYKHAFTDTVPVTATLAGGQLLPEGMVKMRGVLVGEVREVTSRGDGLTAEMAIESEHVDGIPAGVTARLVPTTLFGEYYVDLVPPSGWQPSDSEASAISAGDVIPQDRTVETVELQQALADVYPLLRAVRPADLNATLYAMATALEGRGDAIGANLERSDAYLRRLNPHMRTAVRDLDMLGEVSHAYADAAPDLARLFRASAFTSRTLVEQDQALARFFADMTSMAGVTESTISENEANLVRLARYSRGPLELYARYAPEYPCLLGSMVEWEPRAEKTMLPNRLHITLKIVRQRNAYGQDEYPAYADHRGPNCQTLPDPHVPATTPRGGNIRDGTHGPESYRDPTDVGSHGVRSGTDDLAELLSAR